MAMLPFCGYHMGDYWQHWLDMGERGGEKMPKVFHVNWFRKDKEGDFLWPGFGDNMRVLEWIIKRSTESAEAIETSIGYLPTVESLNLAGLDASSEVMDKLLDVNEGEWRREAAERGEYLEQFGEKLPAAMKAQNDTLASRLKANSAA
jgi:phosphoenolpyruvate carboxykinase (GTP)